jgi:hypothetical protein
MSPNLSKFPFSMCTPEFGVLNSDYFHVSSLVE